MSATHYLPDPHSPRTACGRRVRASLTAVADRRAVTCRQCVGILADTPEPARVPEPRTASPRTWEVGKAKTHVCAGECGERKPVTAFPTTGTAGLRGVVCRSCRDAGKKVASS